MVSVTHSLTKAGDDAAARALLVGAFVKEVLETIGSKSGRDYAAECAAAWHGAAA